MAQRLVKVAKELNVGTTSIVEHLISAGFEIENKPSAKITDEMYNELLKEFQGSLAVKEKADQLVLGTRQGVKEETPEPPKTAAPTTPPPPPPPPPAPEPEPEVAPEPEVIKEEKKEEAPVVEEVKEEKEEEKAPSTKPGVKVLGKIDLDKVNEKPKAKKAAPKKETPKKEETPVAEKPVEAKPEAPAEKAPEEKTVPAAEKAPGEELIRAKTPQLKGLKILGKVDADKLKDPVKKKKETEKPKSGGDQGEKRRRKRTRKKIEAPSHGRGGRRQGGRQGGGPPQEVKEVTQKEIEQSIKATMARLSGGGKSKRQKIRRDKREEMREKEELKAAVEHNDKLQITEFISVSELASMMDVPATDVIMTCMNLGVIVSINQRLDAEIIELVAEEFDHEVEFISAESTEEEEEIIDDPADLKPRAPIVTVMGHVDHGKTSLLDFIRSANVADGEAGGITQHIGAYEVRVGPDKKKMTFLDTPGHEAFTAMRARGAKVTDVVVVIVAADDRIMPQTKEAISHAQAAQVPIVFAINKIDKPGANPERIKEELSQMNLLVEDWGGKYQSMDISAKQGTGIEGLLEKILLEAEMLELQANPDRLAIGTVIEASLDKGRGYVSKMLVQTGTLSIGDAMVAGEHSGKVKAMFNERGKKIKKAGPSTPVLVLGLGGAPQAGEKFKVLENEQETRQIASKRAQIAREQTNRASKRVSLDEIGRRLALGSFKELNLIIKGDVDGSIEALSDSLIKLSIESVQVNVIHKAVGQITESDVLLATASDAIIIGFQVRPSSGARMLAEREGVEIKTYSIIYEAIDQIKSAIEGMLEPTKEEKIVGNLEVRDTFKISKVGTIAGCFVTDGYIKRNSNIRLIREGIVVFPIKEGAIGEISTLKRFKDDAKEVKKGVECGLTIKNFNDIKVGDQIEVYEITEVAQTYDG